NCRQHNSKSPRQQSSHLFKPGILRSIDRAGSYSIKDANMRYLFLSVFLLALSPRPTLHAASFDYYLFSLSWSPEYCHEHPKDKTPECNAQAKNNFVVHGLWPSNKDGSDPSGCSTTPYNPSAVPKPLPDVMPKNLFSHEWREHGVCSGMTES